MEDGTGMNKISCLMDFAAKNVLRIVMGIVFFIGLFIKPMYNFDDSPYFELITSYDVICGLVIFGISYVMYRFRNLIQERVRYIYGFAAFMFAALLFIYFVPLTPFSDMKYIYESALQFSKLNWTELMQGDYWQMFSSNLYLGVFWGILLLPFPKTLVTMKVLNALFAYGIIFFTAKIAESYHCKYNKVIYVYLIQFMPLILYINHIYCEMPFIFLCTLAIYLYKSKDKIILAGVILGIARYLRSNATIFLLAMCFDIIFKIMKSGSYKTSKKNILRIGLMILLFNVIFSSGLRIVKENFIGYDVKSYPKWNQFYIGINEEEFGFMNGDFSYERSLDDVIQRVEEYGPIRLTKIFAKKIHWTWMQGTYQAQRYGFGLDVDNALDKFEYETFVTKYLCKDTQIVRKIINASMRAQYMILFAGMLIVFWTKREINNFRLLYYIIIATMLILIIYEMKSRFILYCLPLMAVLACISIECFETENSIGG